MKVRRVFGLAYDLNWVSACESRGLSIDGVYKAYLTHSTEDVDELKVLFPDKNFFYSTFDKRWEVVKSSPSELEKWV